MSEKVLGTKEAAVEILKRVTSGISAAPEKFPMISKSSELPKVLPSEREAVMAEAKEMDKAAPEQQNAAQMQGVKVPQPAPPKAEEKILSNKPKKPMLLKSFMQKVESKRGSHGKA